MKLNRLLTFLTAGLFKPKVKPSRYPNGYNKSLKPSRYPNGYNKSQEAARFQGQFNKGMINFAKLGRGQGGGTYGTD